jgi:hypothetical protein
MTLVPSLTSKHALATLAHRRAITELAADHPAQDRPPDRALARPRRRVRASQGVRSRGKALLRS